MNETLREALPGHPSPDRGSGPWVLRLKENSMTDELFPGANAERARLHERQAEFDAEFVAAVDVAANRKRRERIAGGEVFPHMLCPDPAAHSRSASPDPDPLPKIEKENPMTRWHLGSMNDGLFILDGPPSPGGTDDPPGVYAHDPEAIVALGDMPIETAQAIVDAHNAALAHTDTSEAAPASGEGRLTCEERERDLRQALLEGSYFHVAHDGTPRHPQTCNDCRRITEPLSGATPKGSSDA